MGLGTLTAASSPAPASSCVTLEKPFPFIWPLDFTHVPMSPGFWVLAFFHDGLALKGQFMDETLELCNYKGYGFPPEGLVTALPQGAHALQAHVNTPSPWGCLHPPHGTLCPIYHAIWCYSL